MDQWLAQGLWWGFQPFGRAVSGAAVGALAIASAFYRYGRDPGRLRCDSASSWAHAIRGQPQSGQSIPTAPADVLPFRGSSPATFHRPPL